MTSEQEDREIARLDREIELLFRPDLTTSEKRALGLRVQKRYGVYDSDYQRKYRQEHADYFAEYKKRWKARRRAENARYFGEWLAGHEARRRERHAA